MQVVRELTKTSIFLGILIGVIMTAANVYLGLYAGMTVSASIPAAVLSMGFYSGILRRSSLYESNIVQTMASAGESLAAGVIFTLPALLLVGAWNKFEFWPTTLIAIAGGLLGVIFMIPLRKALIIEDKNLIYPEGIACAAVLRVGSEAGAKKGFVAILKGIGLGAVFKFLSTGMNLIKGSVEVATKAGQSVLFIGSDISPALVAVGYIVKLEVAVLILIGGMIGWTVGIPLEGTPVEFADLANLDLAWTLWSKKIRFLGVGAMIVGGVWSIISVRKGIVAGLNGINAAYKNKDVKAIERTDVNLGLGSLVVLLLLAFLIVFGLYYYLIQSFGLSLLTTFLMIICSFIFVAVSSYVVGLVGSSNNPVSGMTISALLVTSAFFLVLGFTGQSAILSTLGVAAVVCCAACTAGDCSQDLKTGHLIGATPRSQQIAEVIGIVVPAFVIAPVLTLLHNNYGIGTGLKAPQATLFASITNALFADGNLPIKMVLLGMLLGVVVIAFDKLILEKRQGFRLHLMPMAVGIYLPITLAVPMFFGGLIHHFVHRKNTSANEGEDNGVLMSSGLIAGEAVMGVVVALLMYFNISTTVNWLSHTASELLSIIALAGMCFYLFRMAKSK